MSAGPADLRHIASGAFRPPVHDLRFWVVQGLVVVIAVLHEIVDFTKVFRGLEAADVAPVALFLVPIVYSALSFGLTGSFATAVWVTAVTIPDLVFGPHDPSAAGDILQLCVVDAVALFVGTFVERERVARREADVSAAALARSAAQYRTLFESSLAPTLVVDAAGEVREANPAARRLLGDSGTGLADLLGADAAAAVLGGGSETVSVAGRDGREHTLRPLSTPAHGPAGEGLVQVVLQDVTEETRSQRRARFYAASVIEAQEEERQRIALEIHDEPVQELIHLCRMLDAIAAGEDVGASGRESLERARAVAATTADNLRRLARTLRPPALEDLGLVAALRSFVRAFGERTGIEVEFEAQGEPQRLGQTTEIALFRIAQEALHNVERHSGARRAAVSLEHGAEVRLEVRDDGRGFDPTSTAAAASGSLGLLGIQERAGAVGGTVEVGSAPGRGTRVVVRVPTRRPLAGPRSTPAQRLSDPPPKPPALGGSRPG